MSRTYRRINAFDKEKRIKEPGVGFQPTQRAKRGFDVGEEKYWNRKNKMFHTDNWLDDEMIFRSYKLGLTSDIRAYENQKLVKAINRNETEEFQLAGKKETSCMWYLDYMYFY